MERQILPGCRLQATKPSARLNDRLADLGVGPLSTNVFHALVVLPDAYLQLTVPSFEFPRQDLPDSVQNGGAIKLQVGTHQVTRLVDTFALGNNGEPVAYVGSSGYLEIAVNKANAARTLNLGRGTPVILTK